MPKPATFTPAETSALVSRLCEVWRPGSLIMPWLWDHADRLTKLNREERFSWAAVANDTNDLGAFTLAYLGQTDQIVSRQLGGSVIPPVIKGLDK